MLIDVMNQEVLGYLGVKFEKREKYTNPYRAVNFKRDESGNLICPNGKNFRFKSSNMSIKTNMGETKKFMNADHVRVAYIKKGFALRHPKTEPFA